VDRVLNIENVSKRFGGLWAVRNCSLFVEQGTVTGLIGPNGAGKTTLFHLIAGFYRPDSGRIEFDGEDITGQPPHRLFHRGLYRTFQIPRVFPEMTVLENLMMVPGGQVGERFVGPLFLARRVRRQEELIRKRALEVLEFVGLAPLSFQLAGSLSGGQKKLLELARALMAEPKLVLLDEPGAGVNPTLMKRLADRIRSMAADFGVTVLLIEHDMDLVMGLCNPVVVMSEGRVLTSGTPEEVRSDPRVIEAYLGGQYAVA
jgi:branched-chain amino acid transport system ATP-binding protein